MDEGPVTGTGRVAGAARSRGHDAHGDQLAGVEVGNRVDGYRAGYFRRDWPPACMGVKNYVQFLKQVQELLLRAGSLFDASVLA